MEESNLKRMEIISSLSRIITKNTDAYFEEVSGILVT